MMDDVRELPEGDHKDFPIKKQRTIKNYITLLNAEGYMDGLVWTAETLKEQGIIRARRVS